jgi:translocation and assembly module TamB
MKRRHVVIVAALALLIAVPAVVLHWLIYTREGLQYVLASLGGLESVRIEVDGVDGTLAGPLSFGHVVVDHEAVRVEADGVRGTPSVARLLAGRIDLEQASIDRVEVTIKDRGPRPESAVHFLPAWLGLSAHGATLRRVEVRLKDGTRLRAAVMRGDVRMTRWRIDVSPFAVEDPAGRLDGEVYLRAMSPLGLRGSVAGHWRLPDGQQYRFAAAAHGQLDRLGIDAVLTAPARISFSGSLLGLETEPRAVGTLRAIDFDGSPWLPGGRIPLLNAAIAVDAGNHGIGVDGTITSPATGADVIRVHGSARYAAGTLDLVSLRAWMPRPGGSLAASGTVVFGEHAPTLAIDSKWTALRWPMAGNPVVESPSGSARLEGTLPYRFELTAQARGAGLPTAEFSASGQLDREQLVIDRVDGSVLQGRLTGSGRLSFHDDQAWQASVDGRGLDLAVLRKDLSGRIDVEGRIEGRGFSAAGPWTARLSKLSGRLGGHALTGSGTVAYEHGDYDLQGVRIVNAGSHVTIDGRYGAQMDLRWDASLESLALLHPSLDGRLESTGTLRGTLSRPEITGVVTARRLHVGDIEAGNVNAEVDVDLADHRDSRVLVRADNATAGSLRLDSARLEASGRFADHRMSLALVSPGSESGRVPGFEAKLAASGTADLEHRSWAGTLEQASFDFTDGNARLASPVALEFGPQLARATPLCLVTGDARLCAEGEWHGGVSPSWRALYSAEDWPLRRLLTTLLGRREFDGMLQASGWAEQQPGHDWVGGLAVLIDKPTLEIRRNRFRSDTVEIGGGRVDVYADEDVLRATAELQMAASTKLTGHASAERHHGLPLTALPVTGEIRAESAVLTALPLFVPEIDKSDGRLEASVRVGGTLGDPRFDGDFHLRDGRLDLYRTNLSLTAATLDGQFAGDTVSFEGQATTRKGPVTLNGRFSWPGGVMTGSMRLTGNELLVADTPEYRVQASPDISVAADATGYVVTGQVLIPWARISPRDLSSSVGTSADERIVGAPDAEEAAQPLTRRVHAKVRVALGDDVRVDSYGLKAHLGGEVAVTMDPGEEAHGTGAIRVLDGEYKAFGVYVKIVKGVLSYHDTPLSRPTLDLVARREIPDADVTVSVNVRGRIDQPFITLTSDPAMPSNEALSYLLTGRSLNNLQSGEVASVNRAAETLAVSGGGLLLGGIGSRVGLDEVSVEGTTKNDTQVVLGKFLSPKLFVSYGVSIAEAINTIKLRYTLNARWALKAEAGLEQGADVEFKIER